MDERVDPQEQVHPDRRSLSVTVDQRERRCGLVRALSERWPLVYTRQLAIGDVEIGPRVIVERKTVHDFVVSLRDGRLYRQAHALRNAAGRALLVVEGRDGVPWANTSARALRAALLTLATGYCIPVLRTGDVEETAELLAHLAELETRRRDRFEQGNAARRAGRDGQRFGGKPPAARVAMDMLGAIPGVGDLRASVLIERFGSVGGVVAATDEELADLPGVGPETVRRVRRALDGDNTSEGSDDQGGAGRVGEGDLWWRPTGSPCRPNSSVQSRVAVAATASTTPQTTRLPSAARIA